MIVGLTVLAITISLLLFYNSSTTPWRMFAFLLKRGETTSQPHEHAETRYEKIQTQAPNNPNPSHAPKSPSSPDHLQPEDPSPNATPKVTPQGNDNHIPSFALFGDLESDDEDDEENLPPPQFPALNSIQRASGLKNGLSIPPIPQSSNPTAPPKGLMPPPPLPSRHRTTLAVPLATASLRISSSGPLPSRGIAPSPSSGLSVQLTAAVKTPNPRKKVLLAPGHSPLDWAHLIKSNKNLSGVDRLKRVTPSMLKYHNGRRGKPAWASYQGKVYNISPYLPYHPGGEGELKRAAGKDGEKLFMEVHPWVNWDNMLGDCLVGITVSESDGVRAGEERNMDDVE
jgi:cytochrome b involved in lipid metabolism